MRQVLPRSARADEVGMVRREVRSPIAMPVVATPGAVSAAATAPDPPADSSDRAWCPAPSRGGEDGGGHPAEPGSGAIAAKHVAGRSAFGRRQPRSPWSALPLCPLQYGLSIGLIWPKAGFASPGYASTAPPDFLPLPADAGIPRGGKKVLHRHPPLRSGPHG